MRIIGGLVSVTFDDNARTGQKTSHNYEGAYGFHFGWNLWDTTAPELEVRYATKRVRSSREHIVNINMNVKYSFITNKLTNNETLKIMPYVAGGPAGLLSGIPGDPLANDELLFVWGLGFSGQVGVDFLVKRYLYFGCFIQGDVLYIPSVNQTIAGTSQKIIAGGWEPELGVMAAAGVHF